MIDAHKTIVRVIEVNILLDKEKIFKGLKHPNMILPYLLGRLFPESKWGPVCWKDRKGNILFNYEGFVSNASNRPEFAANIYYEVSGLQEILHENLSEMTCDASLEIGCGYGRLSPWIARFSRNHFGVDPNSKAIEATKREYPSIKFSIATSYDLPFENNSFDLVITWTVLQHVPPEYIERSAKEIKRVLNKKGLLLICEKVREDQVNDDSGTTFTRTIDEYARLFSPLELIKARPRPVEPTYFTTHGKDGVPSEEVMCFQNSQNR